MKANKFFLGLSLFACASFCACSSDDVETGGDSPKVFTGDEAYINVRLSDVGTGTRATSTDGGYEYGTDEHAVSNAFFYFYDANGAFVSEGSAWNGGNVGTAANIEFTSNNVVVLKGLTGKNFPKYMVTVLNRPTGFTVSSSSTLDDMKAKLASETSVGIREGSNFVMSTTSYKHDDGVLTDKYFVTEVDDANFSLDDPNVSTTDYVPVNVYVERLAAKVTLDVSSDLATETINGKEYYKVKATVAGEGNDDDATKEADEDNDDDASDTDNQIAAEDLYVEILGWKLNATAKRSYIVKNIDESWDNTESGALGFVWNKPADYRSFWGQSFNYGKSGYPTTSEEATTSEYLDYVNLNDPLALGKSDYCAENTNTSEIVTANYPSAVTSVLLSARVCDKEGEPLDLVRFNGVLFTKNHYPEYILNAMKAKGQLWDNVWIKTSADGVTPETYESLGQDYIEIVYVGDEEVNLQLKDNLPDLYKAVTTTVDGEEVTTYVKIEDTDEDKALTSFISSTNALLAVESGGANYYKGGLMYYNIPIEHLNNNEVDYVDGNEIIPEAKYGVVRNHHYYITVNKLENLGKGIFDPDEVIVPKKGDDGGTYYVGADINILSWKIVSQGVDL